MEKFFSPEFRNRLDAIVTFNNLNEEILYQIVKKEIGIFTRQLAEKNVVFEISDLCLKWLGQKGYSKEFGAREISRVVQEKIKNFFVDQVLFGELKSGGKAVADIENDSVVIKIIK